jgi:hypothetical protein
MDRLGFNRQGIGGIPPAFGRRGQLLGESIGLGIGIGYVRGLFGGGVGFDAPLCFGDGFPWEREATVQTSSEALE